MDQTPEYCLSPTCSALFQTRSMLQEITEQNDRLEAVNRDLNASRNDWKALAESKSARVAELERRLADEERGHGICGVPSQVANLCTWEGGKTASRFNSGRM